MLHINVNYNNIMHYRKNLIKVKILDEKKTNLSKEDNKFEIYYHTFY